MVIKIALCSVLETTLFVWELLHDFRLTLHLRFKSYCQRAMVASTQTSITDAQKGAFVFEKGVAFVIKGSGVAYDMLTDVCTRSKCNFTGAALTVLKLSNLGRIEGEVSCLCIT